MTLIGFSLHQSHYEQFGELNGTFVVEDQLGECEVSMRGMRDHTCGDRRDWSEIHRYAMQFASFDDGSYAVVGNVCIPKTFSR